MSSVEFQALLDSTMTGSIQRPLCPPYVSSCISQILAQALLISQVSPATMVMADKLAPTARKATTKMKHVSPHSMNQALPELTDMLDAVPDGAILRKRATGRAKATRKWKRVWA
ncbi:Hypothetical predicted protein [Pelobates cultripes]|uniref:Uncharacterized protein n=1 Tax=Pelobates cultripes TaxID=61616 RepID=A0AAD1SIY6_PELCU|nr:Hypothetical predicted protein [Pelobates cultripes]